MYEIIKKFVDIGNKNKFNFDEKGFKSMYTSFITQFLQTFEVSSRSKSGYSYC